MFRGDSRRIVLRPFFLGASRGRSCGRAALQFVRDGSCSALCRGRPLQGQRRPRGRQAEPAEKWPSWVALTREDASKASTSVSRRSRRLSALPHVSSRAASEASGTRLPRWWRFQPRQTAHPLRLLRRGRSPPATTPGLGPTQVAAPPVAPLRFWPPKAPNSPLSLFHSRRTSLAKSGGVPRTVRGGACWTFAEPFMRKGGAPIRSGRTLLGFLPGSSPSRTAPPARPKGRARRKVVRPRVALSREDASEASLSVSRRSRRLLALPHASSCAASEASGTRLPRWWRLQVRQT